VKDISGVRFRTNLDKIRSAGLASNFELSLVTLDRFFKALSALFGKHHDYHRWVKKMDLALYRNCYRIFFEEKKSEVVFATMKGCLEVLELIRLRSKGSYGPGKMLAYYHVRFRTFPMRAFRFETIFQLTKTSVLSQPTLEGFFEMCGLLPSRSYVQKELEDVDNWHRFSVRNRESAQPPVFKDSNRPSHQQPPNATDWRQLSILVLTVAQRYRADYGDWGYFVGDRLNVLVEEAKSSGDDHSYHTLDHYLRELLACRVSELPTPQKIVSPLLRISLIAFSPISKLTQPPRRVITQPPAIWEIGVPPYIVPHVS